MFLGTMGEYYDVWLQFDPNPAIETADLIDQVKEDILEAFLDCQRDCLQVPRAWESEGKSEFWNIDRLPVSSTFLSHFVRLLQNRYEANVESLAFGVPCRFIVQKYGQNHLIPPTREGFPNFFKSFFAMFNTAMFEHVEVS